MKQSRDCKTAIHKDVLTVNSSMCPEFVCIMDGVLGVRTNPHYRQLAVKPVCVILSRSQACSIDAQNLTPSSHSCPSWVFTWEGHPASCQVSLHSLQVHQCPRYCYPSPREQQGRQRTPTLLDIPVSPPLAPGPPPTEREKTVHLEVDLQQCLNSSILWTLQNNVLFFRSPNHSPLRHCLCQDSCKGISSLWTAQQH